VGSILKATCGCGFSITIKAGRQTPDGQSLMPAVCEECHTFLVVDYRNPICPDCGKKVLFYGEMMYKFIDYSLLEEKHTPARKRAYKSRGKHDETLAMPMACQDYWCPKCDRKRLRFEYTGFWGFDRE
jgi:hypothetical protein